jgi:hypothetical protein
MSKAPEAQTGRGDAAFNRQFYERLDATLAEYISALQSAPPAPKTS